MDLLDKAGSLMTELIPPHDAEGDKVWRWRVVIAATLGVSVMANVLHIAWACGFLASFGLSGFAKAADVASINVQLSQIQIGQLKQEILATREIQCKAMKAQDPTLGVITRDLQNSLDQFYQIAHYNYQLPDCSML